MSEIVMNHQKQLPVLIIVFFWSFHPVEILRDNINIQCLILSTFEVTVKFWSFKTVIQVHGNHFMPKYAKWGLLREQVRKDEAWAYKIVEKNSSLDSQSITK